MLTSNGWHLKRHGANHDIYEKDGQNVIIPRHSDISEILAKEIIHCQGLK